MIYIDDRTFKLNDRTVVTLGKFDGVHRGHIKLMNEARKIADEENLKMVVFTFKLMPDAKFDYMDKKQITSSSERRHIIEEAGADVLIEYPFDERTADMQPLEFLEKVVRDMINAEYVVVGNDWTFGHKGKGNTELLLASQKLYSFNAVIMDKELYDGREISSTWVKEEIALGNMENVNLLLGRPFFIEGKVVHGNELGRTMGFPTVNIEPEAVKILPPNGVYAVKIIVEGNEYHGVCNIGVKPTVTDEGKIVAETNIIGFDGDLYGKNVRLMLFHFQRPEMKFGSIEQLSAQLNQDIEFTKSYFIL